MVSWSITVKNPAFQKCPWAKSCCSLWTLTHFSFKAWTTDSLGGDLEITRVPVAQFLAVYNDYESCYHLEYVRRQTHIHHSPCMHTHRGEITWCITTVLVWGEACFNFRARLVILNGNIMGRDRERWVAGKQENQLNYTAWGGKNWWGEGGGGFFGGEERKSGKRERKSISRTYNKNNSTPQKQWEHSLSDHASSPSPRGAWGAVLYLVQVKYSHSLLNTYLIQLQ